MPGHLIETPRKLPERFLTLDPHPPGRDALISGPVEAPTLVVMRDGQEVDRIAGAPSKPDLVAGSSATSERVG